MTRGFQVDRYGEFLGKIPADILRLIPPEDRRGVIEQAIANAAGRLVTGWKISDGGIPYPVFRAQLSTHGTF